MLRRELCFGRWGLMGATVAAVLLVGSSALAQRVGAEARVNTAGLGGAAATGDTDHDRFVGSFAVGYLGARSVPLALNPTVREFGDIIQMDADVGAVDAPVIGVRYWFDEGMGVDFGLGFRRASGKATWTRYQRNPDPNLAPSEFTFEQNDVTQTGVLLHAGLPIALNTEKHYVFELVPEANIGFSSGKYKDQQPRPPLSGAPTLQDDIKLSGFRLDIGARVGSEVHFGFIGVPNLALQASVGIFFSMQKVKADGGSLNTGNNATRRGKTKYEASSMDIATTVHDSPWGIFTNSVSALYYF